MDKPVETMTLDEVRAEIAQRDGWEYRNGLWYRGRKHRKTIPTPIRAHIADMPADVIISSDDMGQHTVPLMHAFRAPDLWVSVALTGNTRLDRFRLLLLILRKEKPNG